jgi:small conductance mechanosensitive channel
MTEPSAFLTGLWAWAAQALPQLLAAIVLLIGGVWLSGWAARAVGRIMDRQERIDPTLHGVLVSLVHYGILILVAVAALGQLGIQTTSVLAVIGAAGLAIGLALQGTLANIAAGIMLLWLRPFRAGDYIDAGGIAGTVKEVGLFATELHTWDGIYQFVPNNELWNKRVVNYSRLPMRLVEVKFGIAYSDDIETARRTLLKLAGSDQRIRQEPPPEVFVAALADSAVVLSLRAWAPNSDYWPVVRSLTERGKIELEGAGLTIPFPQRDLHHHGLAEVLRPPGGERR